MEITRKLKQPGKFHEKFKTVFFLVAQVVERPLKRQKDVPRRGGSIHIDGEKSG